MEENPMNKKDLMKKLKHMKLPIMAEQYSSRQKILLILNYPLTKDFPN